MNEKKIIRNRILAVALMLIALSLFILLGQRIYFRQGDANQIRLQGFYLEDKNSLDVVLLGSSEVYNDFSSAEAYRVSGITSYPFGLSSNSVALWKYELKEIDSRQNPRILVVELNGACYGKTNTYKYAPFRNLSDSMPLSRNKIDLIEERTEKFTDEDKLSFYMPVFKYHGEIKHNPLTVLSPILRGYNVLRGAFSHPGVILEKHKALNYIHEGNTPLKLYPDAEDYFMEFLDACDESDIERIVFVQFPHLPISEKAVHRNRRYLELEKIVEARGYEYVNLNEFQDEMGLVPEDDYYDGEHLNARGQQKFTHWFMDYLIENYNLKETTLTEKQKQEWDNSAKYIEEFYNYYEEYLKEHPDKKTREKVINENYRTVKILSSRLLNENASADELADD